MATSGTTAFDLDFTEIAEEAWERAGREMRTGYDLRTARRSMNLMLIEWQNRGINMWTVDEGVIPLVAGTQTYDLPADTIDLLEHVLRTGTGSSQQDTTLSRISVSTFATIANKNVTGTPLQVFIQRTNPPQVTLWPTPSEDGSLVYWRMRRIEDAGSGVQTADISFRFLPCLVAGLAYHIAMKVPELEMRLPMLKQEYEELFLRAAEEDREKATLRLVPRVR